MTRYSHFRAAFLASRIALPHFRSFITLCAGAGEGFLFRQFARKGAEHGLDA